MSRSLAGLQRTISPRARSTRTSFGESTLRSCRTRLSAFRMVVWSRSKARPMEAREKPRSTSSVHTAHLARQTSSSLDFPKMSRRSTPKTRADAATSRDTIFGSMVKRAYLVRRTRSSSLTGHLRRPRRPSLRPRDTFGRAHTRRIAGPSRYRGSRLPRRPLRLPSCRNR